MIYKKGFCFLPVDQPIEFIKKFNNFKFDKNHQLLICLFDELFEEEDERVDKPLNISKRTPFYSREFTKEWLTDPQGRDQCIILKKNTGSISYLSSKELNQVYQKDKWTDSYFSWSSKGSYLTTNHQQVS